MATYYVDLSGTWAVAQTGADHVGAEWQGPAGAQEAFDTVGVDDIVYYVGTADLGRLVTLTVNDTTSWAAGDDLQNNNLGGGSPGDDWSSAVLYEVTDGTHIIMEMQPGETIDDIDLADGVDNTTQVDQETCSVKEVLGIQADGTDGADGDEIFQLGCNGSWVEDGTLVVFDGGSTATKATNCIYINGIDYYQWRNIRCTDASGDGLLSNSAGVQDHHILSNCEFDNNGGAGANVEEMEYVSVNNSKFHTNGSHGLNNPHLSSKWDSCVFYNNTGSGVNQGTDTDRVYFAHCIAHNNTGEYGIKLDTECITVHCIADGQVTGIRHAGAIGGLTHYCRLTNCSSRGLVILGSHVAAWNSFYANVTDDILGGRVLFYNGADTNLYDPDADDGYNDRANDDFNLKDSRSYTGETEYIDLGIGS